MNGKIILNRMRKNPFFMVGTITSIFILVVVLLTPVLAQYDPIKNSLPEKFLPPCEIWVLSPSGSLRTNSHA